MLAPPVALKRCGRRLIKTLLGRRLAVNDSWIAATAIAHGLPLVTQDRDYTDVPGLTVLALV